MTGELAEGGRPAVSSSVCTEIIFNEVELHRDPVSVQPNQILNDILK